MITLYFYLLQQININRFATAKHLIKHNTPAIAKRLLKTRFPTGKHRFFHHLFLTSRFFSLYNPLLLAII